MKTIKLFAVGCCALVCAFTFSSCEKQTSATYAVGLFDYGGGSGVVMDYADLENYLTGKECPMADTWTITDASLEKCDQQAKAKFENLVKNLSREEIAEKLSTDFYFTYGCKRSKPEPAATIGEWKYPVE